MASSPDPYARMRPRLQTPADEMCACSGAPPLALVARFGPHPLACFVCNGEVAPERISAEPALVDAVAAWHIVYEALYSLWLDSREYEAFARTQLLAASSPVNQRGLALAERLATSVPVYYWWFSEGLLAGICPRCNGPVATEGRHQVCSRCHIIAEPQDSAG